ARVEDPRLGVPERRFKDEMRLLAAQTRKAGESIARALQNLARHRWGGRRRRGQGRERATLLGRRVGQDRKLLEAGQGIEDRGLTCHALVRGQIGERLLAGSARGQRREGSFDSPRRRPQGERLAPPAQHWLAILLGQRDASPEGE